MKSRVRKTVEIARVIVVQMRQDDVGYLTGIHADQWQCVGRITQQIALPPCRRFLRKPAIHQVSAIAAPQHPHEVIEVRTKLVRIGKNEALTRKPVAQVRVLDRNDFERFRGLIDVCHAITLTPDVRV